VRSRSSGAAVAIGDSWRGRPDPSRLLCTAALLLSMVLARPEQLLGQQFVTDDAALVGHRACQVEVWHGERASWLQPACQPLRRLEITAGLGSVPGNGGRSAEHVLEGKALLREMTPGGLGIAAVGGLGFGALAEMSDGMKSAFAYVPVSVSLAADRLILHVNAGWHFERDVHEHNGVQHADAHHAATWAARADLLLPFADDRLTVIGELYGEDRDRPEYQGGIRSIVLPDRLTVDVSWGGHSVSGRRGAGWTLGATWTPPPFF